MSLVLRHQPQKIDLKLDEQGWANTADLIDKIEGLDLTILKQVVETNAKKRFAFNADETKIRASQGHSIKIDLGYEPVTPPEFLFHGTAIRNIESIKKTGLAKRNRHHVHLSADKVTASSVGQRHGKPIILIIKSQKMFDAGYEFFVSDNQVWLTDNIPVEFIDFNE